MVSKKTRFRPKENKALFPAHRVTKMNVMRAAGIFFFWKMCRDKYTRKFANRFVLVPVWCVRARVPNEQGVKLLRIVNHATNKKKIKLKSFSILFEFEFLKT